MLHLKKNESGRSMVEMLGVLAIIGMLSVMGIAGYTQAMKKHRANVLFEETLKRAVSIAGQLGFGLTNPNLNAFEANTEYGTFAFAPPVADATQFTLSLSNVSERVCEQLKSMAEGMGVVQNTEANCGAGSLTFTFNNDLRGAGGGGGESGNSGNDSPATEPCPAERQCGNACCAADNTCNQETGQCCSEALNYCCADGLTVVRYHGQPSCCPSGQVFREGGGGYACCSGVVYKEWTERKGDVCCGNADEEPYCFTRDSSNKCVDYVCGKKGCINSCLQYQDDVCIKNVCCPEGEEAIVQPWGAPACQSN